MRRHPTVVDIYGCLLCFLAGTPRTRLNRRPKCATGTAKSCALKRSCFVQSTECRRFFANNRIVSVVRQPDRRFHTLLHSRKKVHDALNNAMPGQRKRAIMCLNVESAECAHGFASRIQRFNENPRTGAD